MSDGVFHEHLDVCQQCRNHPLDLCDAEYRRAVAEYASIKPIRNVRRGSGPLSVDMTGERALISPADSTDELSRTHKPQGQEKE